MRGSRARGSAKIRNGRWGLDMSQSAIVRRAAASYESWADIGSVKVMYGMSVRAGIVSTDWGRAWVYS